MDPSWPLQSHRIGGTQRVFDYDGVAEEVTVSGREPRPRQQAETTEEGRGVLRHREDDPVWDPRRAHPGLPVQTDPRTLRRLTDRLTRTGCLDSGTCWEMADVLGLPPGRDSGGVVAGGVRWSPAYDSGIHSLPSPLSKMGGYSIFQSPSLASFRQNSCP